MATSLEQIAHLQQQIAQLKDAAIQELQLRRTALHDELKAIDAELENLTGKPLGRRGRRPASVTPLSQSFSAQARNASSPDAGKRPDLQELKALLAAAPNKTISLRKEGYEVRNVKILAMANPHLLRMGGKVRGRK